MIEKAILKPCADLDKTMFAPYGEYQVFIIDETYVILDGEVHELSDTQMQLDIFQNRELIV